MLALRFLLLAALLLPAAVQAQDERPVKLTTLSAEQSGLTRQFFGQVVAKRTVDLSFQVGGQILEFPAVEGEPVANDALIAKLDLEPFELALDRARLEKEQADRTFERLERLQGSAASRVTVDDARTAADLAAVAVRDAERALRQAELHAPFEALVASRLVPDFSTIAAGTPVVRLHDMSELRIEIDVPEILFQRAGTDPDVEITARFPTSDQTYTLIPREFNAETSALGQTFRITLGLLAAPDLNILPGSSVTVRATVRGAGGGVPVQPAALGTDPDGSVWVLQFEPAGADSGTVTRKPVEIEVGADGEFLIVAGIDAGAEIVAAGVNGLADGASVRRFTGFPN